MQDNTIEQQDVDLKAKELFDVLDASKEEQSSLKEEIIQNDKDSATKDFVISESINYKAIKQLQEKYPNLAAILQELKKNNKLQYNEEKGEMTFDINFTYSNGGSAAPDTNNYNITITKKGLQVNGELAIPGFWNDEVYDNPRALDKLITTIKDRIIKEEGRLSQEQKDSLDHTMNNAKIVFKSLFLEKME